MSKVNGVPQNAAEAGYREAYNESRLLLNTHRALLQRFLQSLSIPGSNESVRLPVMSSTGRRTKTKLQEALHKSFSGR